METLTLTHLHLSELGLSPERVEYLREDAFWRDGTGSKCICIAIIGDLALVDTRDFATMLTDSEREVLESLGEIPDYIELS